MDLRTELPPAHDRTGHELAEEQLEKCKARQRIEWLGATARQIDQKGRQLENIERDAERNDEVLAEHVEAGGGLEKHAIFEIGETADIEDERPVEPAPVAHDQKLEGVINENDGG